MVVGIIAGMVFVEVVAADPVVEIGSLVLVEFREGFNTLSRPKILLGRRFIFMNSNMIQILFVQ